MLKRRNKALAIGLATLGVISVGTVAFATWIVGVQQKETTLQLSLKVDDVQDSSISVSAALKDKELFITDTQEIKGSDTVIVSTDAVAADALSFSLENIVVEQEEASKSKVVESFEISLVQASSEKLSFDLNEQNNLIETTAGDGTKYRTAQTKVSYLTFATETIAVDKFDAAKKEEGTKLTTTFTLKQEFNKLAFEWGDYFDMKSPAVFYNDIYCTKDSGNNNYNGFVNADDAFIKAQHTNIINELKEMDNYITNTVQNLTLNLKVNFAETK